MRTVFRLSILLACLYLPSAAHADRQQEIKAVLDYYAEMWDEGDFEALRSYYDSDFVLVTSAGALPLKDRLDDISALITSDKDRGKLSYKDVTVEPLGDKHALAYGRMQLKFSDGSSIENEFSTVYVQTPFGWKALLTHQ